MAGTIERGAFFIFLSYFASFISSYIVYFALGRLLGAADFGIYGVTISLVMVINTVLVTTMEQTVSKFVSERPDQNERVKKTALLLHLSISSVIFIVFVLLVPFIAFMLNDISLTPFIYLISPLILLQPLFRLFSGSLNGLKRFSLQSKLVGIHSFAKVVLIIGLVLLGFGLFGAISGFILSSLFLLLVACFMAGLKINSKPLNPDKMIAFAVPIGGLALITTLLMSFDLFAVKAFTDISISSALAGYYNAAGTIAKVIPTLVVAISFVAFPLVSSASFKGNKKKTAFYINHSLRYSFFIIAFLSAIFSSTASEIIDFVYGSGYAPAAVPLEILAIGFGVFAFFLIFVTILSAVGMAKITFLIGVIVLIVDFALNLFTVPKIGMVGAAFSTTIASFLGLILLGIVIKRVFGSLLSATVTVKILLSALLVFAFGSIFPASGLLLIFKYLILSILYVLALLALRELKPFDFLVLKNVLRK